MSLQHAAPQAFSDKPRPAIALHAVDSSQVKAIGYDDATSTLAVRFAHGLGAIYHYPNVSREAFEAFRDAESIGTHFGKHIKPLAFEKYPAEPANDAEGAEAA